MGSPGTEVTKIQSEEPGAGKLHAGICAGGAPKGAFLPRWDRRLNMTKTILTSAVAVMVVAILSFSSGYWTKGVSTKERRWYNSETIDVTGEATADVLVEYARIKAKVTVHDPANPATAKIMSDEIVKTIISSCGKHSIVRSDIDGSHVYVGPRMQYNHEERRQEQHGYEALRSLTVRVNDLDKLDTVLTELVSQDAVTIEGVEFGSDKAEDAYGEALDQAVQVARMRADRLAEAAGFKIVRIADIDDIGWAEFVRDLRGSISEMPLDAKVKAGSSFTKNAITIKAKVSVKYDVVDPSIINEQE
jgi:uncharacterized protein YggE